MKKILFVEDDLMIIRIYRNKFQVEGYDVEVATDGENALEALKKSVPDLVLLDLQLPKVNGVQILKHIRAQDGLKHLPVIVFSNAFLGNLVEEAWKAGATKCLTKASCTPKQLLDVVQTTLQSVPATPPAINVAVLPDPAVRSPIRVTEFSGAAPTLPKVFDGSSDTKSNDLIRRMFIDTAPHTLTALRGHLMTISRASGESERQTIFMEMFRTVHSLTGNAALAGLNRIAQLSSALEALVQELHSKPSHVTPSSIRTLATGVDALATLCESANDTALDVCPFSLGLVVDDEPISRRAVCSALEKAGIKPIALDDPNVALRVLEQNRFDLAFFDVEMPGMSGFDLSTKLRATSTNQNTPVIFVTSASDFESRTRSMLSGGSDLISKPFLLIELAVKALTFVSKPPAKPLAKAA